MVIKLIFDIDGKIFYHKVNTYQLIDDFYIFRDIHTGISKKLHRNFFRGEERLWLLKMEN